MTVLAWQRGGSGDGPLVVLVHAWASDGPGDWGPSGWVDALAGAGLRVLVPDLPGHGASADVPIPAGEEPARWTASVILADLSALHEPEARVAGYAEGCVVAGHLAVRAPDRVPRLVLVGTDDRAALPHGADVAAALRDPAARVWHPDVSSSVWRGRRDQRHALPVLADWAERMAWPAPTRLGSLRTPVLLANGAEDAERRARVPRLARLFHDARVVTAPGDRRGALAAPDLHRTAAAFLGEPSAAPSAPRT